MVSKGKKDSKKQRGFTLIELLVVIVVIGVISSIVVVSLSGSRDKARIAKNKAYSQQVHALLGSEAVGIWDFDEGQGGACSGGEDVCDLSGYGNHGTFGGNPQFVESDIEGYALEFDGDDDYVDTIFNGTEYDTLSFSFWANFDDIEAGRMCVLDNSPGSSGYLLRKNTDISSLVFYVYYDVVGLKTVNINIPDTEWHYYTAIISPTQLFLYQDGENKVESDTWATDTIAGSADTMIIGSQGGGGNYFGGQIDEVRIYSEALSSSEIQKNYVQGLNKLLANNAINQKEYDQRMAELNQSLVKN